MHKAARNRPLTDRQKETGEQTGQQKTPYRRALFRDNEAAVRDG